MSMMGMLRELPADVLERLKADPALVDDVVHGGSASRPNLSSAQRDRMQTVVDGMKATLAENGEEMLGSLPEAVRGQISSVLEEMTPEQRKLFWKQFAEQIAAGNQWEKLSAPPPTRSAGAAIEGSQLGPLLELDKAWHGVHFLLTGSATEATDGVGQAILGGVEIGPDMGYGPARYLTPDQVSAVAYELGVLKSEDLRARFDGVAMQAANVYPGIWDEDDPDEPLVDWLVETFDEVRRFYEAAAARRSAVLLYMT
jgi:hypothetical protein